ncbi:SAM-dependent DNA methyltransferase [Altererythrobacter sp. TH136]|uniref:SAM-dependent DNA methyltransferase n=1 Tax=Altererythrobacter sp. TH136 TaxID=2067415 RepID=UPI0011650E24|nr:SAM-dependent DNA methyltransferase [Altererythrobacter sp. TH136]QDM40802.1 SAM-dependent DNA methyltransferase [Altererythrobacter sp. TH136]
MPTLAPADRRTLERAVKEARIVAEAAIREEVVRLGIIADRAPDHVHADRDLAALRRALREHARALGDRVAADGSLDRLTEAAAYLRWHRLLFVGFLNARGLLRHPDGDPLTLDDCHALAAEEGASDGWSLAARYAAHILPAAFAENDPAVQLTLAPEHEARLRRIVGELPAEVFAATDALGWTYQYWRAAEKDAINERSVKIGADELPAVTQLFTEPYMVGFLIDNTLGAWWAGKRFAADPALAQAPDEETLRARLTLPGVNWAWLRFVREGEDGPWRPAAGTFPGWPEQAAAINMLDPCCGSGHFLTEALPVLVALRCAEDERLDPAYAVAAVLRDNLHGLEIDGRCVQIAAFAVALAAWDVGGWQNLPNPHIAWVGSMPSYTRQEFEALGNGDSDLRRSLGALYDLFRQAPLLGSLIEVTGSLDLVDRANLDGVGAAMARLAERTRESQPGRAEGAIAARGMADAAALLARSWVLQLTNVPYLGRGKQNPDLKAHLERHFSDAKNDLATAMTVRMLRGATPGGSVAAVTPQNWLFLTSYRRLRERLLEQSTLNLLIGLGSRAFAAISGEVVNAAMVALTASRPGELTCASAMDLNDANNPEAKASLLHGGQINIVAQDAQRGNPDSRISMEQATVSTLLGAHALSYAGVNCGDESHYARTFWEVTEFGSTWSLQGGGADKVSPWSGCSYALLWERNQGRLRAEVEEKLGIAGAAAWLRGAAGWGRRGVLVRLMSDLPACLYEGDLWDGNSGAIIPGDPQNLAAIWTFCSSSDFERSVRRIDRKMNVTPATLAKVPFDLAHWSAVAAERYPNGLPEPYSDDPTQWLFHGHPAQAETGTGLHVALARLCGYRWPAESDAEMRLSDEARGWIARAAELPDGDADGLLPLVACGGEAPLADRLRAYLRAAFGAEWSADLETKLVVEADAQLGGTTRRSAATIDDWLRNRAFAQHAKLFHQRPFLWQVWDGREDGFSAFLHYHRLGRAALEKLTYTLLGDWTARSDADGEGGRSEAARALQAKLRAILEGEAPYDVFVRWKPLARQPLGWEPDLDDGVRMNIRPFVAVQVLRAPINIHWRKDRGTDVASAPWYALHGGERINDHHTTLAEKRAARARSG